MNRAEHPGGGGDEPWQKEDSPKSPPAEGGESEGGDSEGGDSEGGDSEGGGDTQ